MDGMVPQEDNIILHGLDIAGDWAAGGPPGTKRPDPSLSDCVFLRVRQSLRTKKAFDFWWRFKKRSGFHSNKGRTRSACGVGNGP